MKAMILNRAGERLQLTELPSPTPGPGQVLIRVEACGVCRTDLHVVDGELPHPKTPLIPGHEIVGVVTALGHNESRFAIGERIGVAWLASTCGHCRYCRHGEENLCDSPRFTGYSVDGGYAEYTVANASQCFRIPKQFGSIEAAPLLCAGLIGYRSLRFAGEAADLGMYGFGAAAHIVTQIAQYHGSRVYAFTRPGDQESQNFALQLGAVWAGDSGTKPPVELDAAIIFAPVGALVPQALAAVRKGGIVVCGGIHMSPIPEFSYDLLWGERQLRSVANLTHRDGTELLSIAAAARIHTTTTQFALEDANEALDKLRAGQFRGAAVIVPNGAPTETTGRSLAATTVG